MDIEGSLRELGPVDSGPLIDAVLGMSEEDWQQQQYRQTAHRAPPAQPRRCVEQDRKEVQRA